MIKKNDFVFACISSNVITYLKKRAKQSKKLYIKAQN